MDQIKDAALDASVPAVAAAEAAPALRRRGLLQGAGVAALLLGGGALLRNGARHVPVVIPAAEEQAILADDALTLHAWRFAPAPSIVVLVFPSLHAQALTLNRAAVFLELIGASRTEVPDDAVLARVIADAHLQFDTFYYAHDYRAADLLGMWSLAERQGVRLLPEEVALRALLMDAAAAPDGLGAVISIPPPGPGLQDRAGRATILRHELSHGVYFIDPDYAAMVDQFWRDHLTEAQRAAFRRYLSGQAYDPSNDELMRNETQAYLVHTADPRFFSAEAVGLPQAEVTALRSDFIAAMPAGWLKGRTPPP